MARAEKPRDAPRSLPAPAEGRPSASETINGQTILVDGGWATTKYLSETGLKSDWVMPARK
ncbi:hypothetical protein [Sphingomonas koreensis]